MSNVSVVNGMKVLDARGCPCPQPLIQTRRLWKTLQPGENFRVLCDNNIAHVNLVRFLADQNAGPVAVQNDDDYTITAVRSGDDATATATASVAMPAVAVKEKAAAVVESKPSEYVVALKSDCMGQGDDALGGILIKAYLNTLIELDDRPSTILCYNGGAKLAARDSGADMALLELQKMGVDVIVCGACVEFFELTDSVSAGRISNMYEIAERLAVTGHVVYP